MLSEIFFSRKSRAAEIGPQANFHSTANKMLKISTVKMARSKSTFRGLGASCPP